MSATKYNQLSDKLIRKSQQNAAKNTSGLFGAVKTKIRRNRAENRCFFGCVSMCEWQYAYAKYFGFAVSVMFSEKKMPVFLFASTVFQVWLCEPVPLECVDAESKGDDGFKTVNLHAAFVRQFDGMLCLIFPQNTAFTKSLYPCSDCWGDNPRTTRRVPTRSWQWRLYRSAGRCCPVRPS